MTPYTIDPRCGGYNGYSNVYRSFVFIHCCPRYVITRNKNDTIPIFKSHKVVK